MYSILVLGGIAFTLSLIVAMLGCILAFNAMGDREKNSAFECGFDPLNSARLPFSLRFFLLAIIFLIFDVEVVLLLPLLSAMAGEVSLSVFLSSMVFLWVVILGLFYEWHEGSLDWLS